MSATTHPSTVTPVEPGSPAQADPPAPLTRFGRVFTGEWVKIRSVRSVGFLALAAALSLVLVGVFNAVGIAVQAGSQSEPVDPATLDPTGASLNGVGAALVAVAALGVVAVTGDYASQTIKTTIAAVPRRSQLLLAKTAAIAALVFPIMLGSALIAFVAAQIVLAQVGMSISLLHPGVARAVVGAALYLTTVAILTAGLGWLVRSTAGALAVWLGLWLLPSLVLLMLPGPLAGRVGPLLPGNAGTALATVGQAGELAVWGNYGVFVLYAATTTVLGLVTLIKRDA